MRDNDTVDTVDLGTSFTHPVFVEINKESSTTNTFFMSYSTYITIYSGNKLPPFFIGYCKTEQIGSGFHGCPKDDTDWRTELQQNQSLFKTKIIKTFKTEKQAIQYTNRLLIYFRCGSNPMLANKYMSWFARVFTKWFVR